MKNVAGTTENVVTIRDIAKMANVSIGTVSRVLNKSGYVSKATKRNVEKAIASTGYIPNVTARSMVSKKSAIVGIIVPEISNPFHSEFVTYANRIFNQEGFSVLLCNSEYDSENINRFINDLIQRNAEGLLVVSTEPEDETVLKKMNMRLETVGVCAKIDNMDCINFTDRQGAFDATKYLITLGHKRIACVGVAGRLSVSRERLRGYKDALQGHGIEVNEQYIKMYEGTENIGFNGTLALLELDAPPTAILYINDYYAINAYSALSSKGLKVGRDVSVCGFDDLPIAGLINPPLTSVRSDIKGLAELSTDLMLKKLHEKKGQKEPETKKILFATHLIKRDSTAPPQ